MHCAVCRIHSDALVSSSKTWLTVDARLLWIEVTLLSKLVIIQQIYLKIGHLVEIWIGVRCACTL